MLRLLRKPWMLLLLAVFGAALGVGLYLFQPWKLFTDRTVDEAAPVGVATNEPVTAGNAETKPGGPLATGSFISHEHGTSGTAKVLKLADGSRVLRIENLDTSDGPDVRVWLSDQAVKKGGWHVFDDGEYVDLGGLKGNKGSQNYAIPNDTDLKKLTSVTIWCRRFHVSFGAAALQA